MMLVGLVVFLVRKYRRYKRRRTTKASTPEMGPEMEGGGVEGGGGEERGGGGDGRMEIAEKEVGKGIERETPWISQRYSSSSMSEPPVPEVWHAYPSDRRPSNPSAHPPPQDFPPPPTSIFAANPDTLVVAIPPGSVNRFRRSYDHPRSPAWVGSELPPAGDQFYGKPHPHPGQAKPAGIRRVPVPVSSPTTGTGAQGPYSSYDSNPIPFSSLPPLPPQLIRNDTLASTSFSRNSTDVVPRRNQTH